MYTDPASWLHTIEGIFASIRPYLTEGDIKTVDTVEHMLQSAEAAPSQWKRQIKAAAQRWKRSLLDQAERDAWQQQLRDYTMAAGLTVASHWPTLPKAKDHHLALECPYCHRTMLGAPSPASHVSHEHRRGLAHYYVAGTHCSRV